MKINFFDLSRQYRSIQPQVEEEMAACMESCGYIGGARVTGLEESLASYLGVAHAMTCGNGTDSLKIALRACGVSAGDEVITTPFSFFATAEAIAAVGAVPVFTDVDKDTFNLDPAKIEAGITKRTKAILPVHIFGAPADMDAINAIALQYGLRVVEDACQAIGAEYKGRKVGGLGDAGCFSFYPTKNLGAFGDGGMITANDDRVATVCKALKAHGMGRTGADAYEILYGKLPDDGLDQAGAGDNALYDPTKYFNYLVGENSRLDAMQAVALDIKLPKLDGYNARRGEIARRYNAALGKTPLQLPLHNDDQGKCCWHQYAVLAPDKDAFAADLGQKGIGTGAFYPVPLHLQKAFTRLGYRPGSMPVAESLCARSVCLPVFPELTEEEQDYIIDAVNAHYGI